MVLEHALADEDAEQLRRVVMLGFDADHGREEVDGVERAETRHRREPYVLVLVARELKEELAPGPEAVQEPGLSSCWWATAS
jgi:hypothetical protein